MNIEKCFWSKPLLAGLLVATLVLAGCSGDDGSAGAAGNPGPSAYEIAVVNGFTGTVQEWMLNTQGVAPESCATCHDGGGVAHQSVYDQYADASAFAVTIDTVASTALATTPETYDVAVTFTILKNGLPYIDASGLPSLDQKRAYSTTYDSTTREFLNSQSLAGFTSTSTPGQYEVTATGAAYAPELTNAQVYIYIADGKLATEGMTLYGDVKNVGVEFGDVETYESAANVAGCEKCHGAPYMKHGYRAAAVAGLPDFAACKACHYDTKTGGHEDWQILADNPARYAEIHAGSALTVEEEAKYAYTANVMNDTHMSHAMEFPYPQSIANCATCHEGKLETLVLIDANFVVETCKSCHAVDGDAVAPALNTVMPTWHNLDTIAVCNSCHSSTGGAPVFSTIHTGYDAKIYSDAVGTKYADTITATIDGASLSADNILTIDLSATGVVGALDSANIVPTVMVGLYGYDTKDFIVAPHGRTVDTERDLEYAVGAVHPRFTTVDTGVAGTWKVTADLSTWADMITAGTVKRAEIAVMPKLVDANSVTVALDAPSKTFDIGTNAFDVYFNPIVDVQGCNACHDALATTYHSGDRGGNITVCRMCHVGLSGGSHLEMQSRSIDSYIHAIHSFQAFDIGDVDFTDPVAAMRYDLHIEHVYPNFSIKNCESCHNAGTYNVPDQSKSMPGKFSGSDTVAGRNIGTVPSYDAGPGSRACGACHRAKMINEDAAGDLASFNQHTKLNGYLVEDGTGVLDAVIAYVMAMFK